MCKDNIRVLVTSGGTRIKFDDVRSLELDYGFDAEPSFGNFSKGGFGWNLCYAMHYMFHPHDFLQFHLHAKDAPTLKDIFVDSYWPIDYFYYEEYAQQLETIMKTQKPHIVFLAAAVSDYGLPKLDGKVSSDQDKIAFELSKLPKLINKVKEWHPDCIQVGFKLLSNVSEDLLVETAIKAGTKAGSDFTIANDLETIKNGRHSVYLVDHSDGSVTQYPVWAKSLIQRFLKKLFEKCDGRKGFKTPEMT